MYVAELRSILKTEGIERILVIFQDKHMFKLYNSNGVTCQREFSFYMAEQGLCLNMRE